MALKPILGPVELTFYSVGVIVGAGVYSIIGAAAGLALQGLWLSFAIGAGVALLTAFSYAEMATSYPHAGAEYIYVRRAWPKAHWLSFGIAMVILIGAAASSTTVAIAFGGYLRFFVDVPPLLSALFLLAACTALNIWGVRESSMANIMFTLIEVGGLLFVVAAGLARESGPPPPPVEAQPAILAAAALLFFVFLGFEEVANLTEEVRRPGRDIPLALFISIAVTTALYVLVALAVVHMATPAELAASEAPLATAMERVWPSAGGMLSAIALFATANTVLITLIAGSRLAFSMARDREIHDAFARLLDTRQTPWLAAILLFVMSAILLPIGSVRLLAEMSSFAALMAFLVVNLALISLRYQQPHHARPFRVPGAIGRLPVLPVLAIASILVLMVHFDWQIYLAGAVAIGLTAVAYGVRWVLRAGPT
ncbi:MAG TPA: APC family permease [Xanthobacteraceae bacterium]|nr:APC family permease [Xanthobacteraceae bacterium]